MRHARKVFFCQLLARAFNHLVLCLDLKEFVSKDNFIYTLALSTEILTLDG